jgi:hypothetical protein
MSCLALAALAGCDGRGKPAGGGSGLTFERLTGLAGLTSGGASVESFDAFRLPDRSLRVKARVRLPEGTRVQVAVKSGPAGAALVVVRAMVMRGEIVSPPMATSSGPLPVGPYQFEISAQFMAGWQSREILRATHDGKSLRGPEIVRTPGGGTMFWLVKEMTR